MLRLIGFLVGVTVVAAGLAWLADRPGELIVQWQGYQFETSVFRAIVILCALVFTVVVAWSLLRQWLRPSRRRPRPSPSPWNRAQRPPRAAAAACSAVTGSRACSAPASFSSARWQDATTDSTATSRQRASSPRLPDRTGSEQGLPRQRRRLHDLTLFYNIVDLYT